MYTLQFHSEDLFTPVVLNKICGEDELSINGISSEDAISLIDRLLIKHEENNYKKGEARLIPISQRDQIMLQLNVNLFGNRILSTIICKNCKEKIDIDFKLSEFANSIFKSRRYPGLKKENNSFLSLPNGLKIRLPNGDDELRANSVTDKSEFLFKQCVPNPEDYSSKNRVEVESILNQLAPLVKSDFPINCPECGSSQQIHFDIQSFFLQRMLNNKKRVLYEIHLLASHYNWTYSELVGLPKKEREQYVKYIETQK